MYHYFFFLMIRQPQRSTLFPHTLLARFQPRALPRRDGSVDPAARVGLSDHLKDHPRVLPRHLPGPVEDILRVADPDVLDAAALGEIEQDRQHVPPLAVPERRGHCLRLAARDAVAPA